MITKSKVIKKILFVILLLLSFYMITSACNKIKVKPAAKRHRGSAGIKKSIPTDFAIATLNGGDILGYLEDGTYTFKGIRYATAERYEVAKLYESWDGIMNALDYKEICPDGSTSRNVFEFMTRSLNNPAKSEDCFFLNVWTQTLEKDAKKPVIVFMHGGGYSEGSSSGLTYYEGQNLSSCGDIVFVSLNHRLNVLGFLDLSAYGNKYKYTPNLGINDLVIGLQWIQSNIEAFGGDPDNITIIGQSGGGAKVTELMGVPSAKGLFNRVWAMSSFVDEAVTQEESQAQAERTLEILGIDAVNIDAIKKVPYNELITAAREAGCSWNPVIDGDFYPEPTFDLTTKTISPVAQNIPIVITSTFSEFNANFPGISVFYNKDMYEKSYLPALTDNVVMEMLKERYGDKAQSVADAFRYAYPKHQLAEVLFVNTQRMKWMNTSLAFANDSIAPVYQGIFAYTLPIFGGVTSFHTGGDLPFIFHNTNTIQYMINGDEFNAAVVEYFSSQALINFAYTGNPSVGAIAWPAFTEGKGDVMVIDTRSGARQYPDAELMKLISGE